MDILKHVTVQFSCTMGDATYHFVKAVPPQIAKMMLENNASYQRDFSKSRAKMYEKAMSTPGEWKHAVGNTFVFCKEKLLDGQHRAHGAVESGLTLSPCVFIEVADEKIYRVIDQNKNRTLTDELRSTSKLENVDCDFNSTERGALLLYMTGLDNSATQKIHKEKRPDILITFAKNNEITNALRDVREYTKKLKAKAFAAFYLTAREIDESLAKEVYINAIENNPTINGQFNKAMHNLCVDLLELKMDRGLSGHGPTDRILYMASKAWNDIRTGEEPKKKYHFNKKSVTPKLV